LHHLAGKYDIAGNRFSQGECVGKNAPKIDRERQACRVEAGLRLKKRRLPAAAMKGPVSG